MGVKRGITLREEHRLRMFERVEVMGDCRKLHGKELHNLCFSLNIIVMIQSWRMR
jgi:hypothetical protein